MNIAVVGTGYVGLVSGTCFAEIGIDVTCVDIDERKIQNLANGKIPIFEPGLDKLVIRNLSEGRLHFTTDLTSCIDNVDIIFSAVGTPPDKNGDADLSQVIEVTHTIGRTMNKYLILAMKSTVPVGTSNVVKNIIEKELKERNIDIPFDVVSNPEFLKEGHAIKDFMNPDRIVIGVESTQAKNLMTKLYQPFLQNQFRVIFTDIPSAEMIKYAANSMLATRISFMNEIANLCELTGADVNMVRIGIGTDSRIGENFLFPGCGYGGSCFPKDIRALINAAEKQAYDMCLLKAVEKVNNHQKDILFYKLKRYHNSLKGKTIGLWGLSFKPGTDDMRDATSLAIINLLLNEGAIIKAYDPIAMKECQKRIGNKIIYAKDMYEVAKGADAILLLTEWELFHHPNWELLHKTMNTPLILDGRNIYDAHKLMRLGFVYSGIGR